MFINIYGEVKKRDFEQIDVQKWIATHRRN